MSESEKWTVYRCPTHGITPAVGWLPRLAPAGADPNVWKCVECNAVCEEIEVLPASLITERDEEILALQHRLNIALAASQTSATYSAERDERIGELERALGYVAADAEQMDGLGMREEAAETFQRIAKTALAASPKKEGMDG